MPILCKLFTSFNLKKLNAPLLYIPTSCKNNFFFCLTLTIIFVLMGNSDTLNGCS